ncbi:response regulator [Flavobacterium cellulosilyticum]|uniref:Response regulator n=1 Tax=Flavobacterium cellulosilyticum TaxID=2541731 RepID=A0A4R5CJ33_9FLAO|nr:response regulator [Flavobacterium cellulosilyticum]TDD98600.1 response regulator [Flavobacterium cellulosilyticum]
MLDTLLFIDDDPITLMLCKMVISKASFSKVIITAKNGEEALQYFDKLIQNNTENKKIPQLIFLDLNMPVMGGWEFLDHFSTDKYSEYNDIKVIILSSTVDPEDLKNSQKYPMILDFLSKPISKEMLEYVSTII